MAGTKRRSRTSISDRLDNLVDVLAGQHVEVCQRLTKLETQLEGVPERITVLERLRWKAFGALTVISGFFSIAATWFLRKH